MNEKWNQYFFGEPTEEEKRELFQELEKNEDMKREFAEMQNIVGLSGLLPREDDSLKGERNLEAMMNRQEKMLRLPGYHLPKALHSRKAEPQRCSKHAETGDLCGGIAHGNQLSCHNVIACPGSGRKKHPEHCHINGKRAMAVPKQKNHNT